MGGLSGVDDIGEVHCAVESKISRNYQRPAKQQERES